MFCLPPLRSLLPHNLPAAEADVAFGWMQGVYALPALLLALVGGLLLDRWESRRAGVLAGLLLLGGSLLFNLGIDYWTMLLGRFIAGVGAILFNLVAARMLSLCFSEKQKGLAMSILNTAFPVAAVITYSTFVTAGKILGWQGAVLALNLFIAATVVTFSIWAPRDPIGKSESHKLQKILDLRAAPRDLWLIAIVWFCFNASMIIILTFGPDFFRESGWDTETSSLMVGMLMWTAIFGGLAAGWMMDRFGFLKYYIIIPAVLCGLCIFGLLTPLHPMFLMLILGFIANFIPVAVYSTTSTIVQPARLGLAFGVILTFSNLGNAIGPVLSGWTNRLSGQRSTGIFLAAMIIISAAAWAAAIGRVKLTQRKLAAEDSDNP